MGISLRKAINDNCKECTYDDAEPGTWRQQVENCTVTSCKLWPVRPISTTNRQQKRGKQPEALRRHREEQLSLKYDD